MCTACGREFGDPSPLSCPDDGSTLLRAADIAAAEGDPMLGRVLASRFTILARIGSGSMGTVYRARQSPIARDVAIKILRSDRAIDEVSRARFLREARANSLLTSPNTVTVFDFGQSEGGDFYLAMELLEGESLGQRIKRMGRIPVEDALETARQSLRSLAEAHAKGIIHRDLKPDNLFFARVRTNEKYEEIVKVLDFGIAKMLHADAELGMNAVETQAGTVFGTPRYMSPEQAQGKPLDARSDLYSLGVILYHMVTGRPPFTDDDAIVVMARHIKTMPRPMSEVAPDARIPVEVENLVMRILSKEPERRPDSADTLFSELTRVKETAAVVSGVRTSLVGTGPLEPVLVERNKSLPPPPPSHVTHDTFSVRIGPVPKSRRGMYVAAALLVVAGAATAIGSFAMQRLRSVATAPRPAAGPSAGSAEHLSAAPPPAPPAASSAVAAAKAPTPVVLPAAPSTGSPSQGAPPPPSRESSRPERPARPARSPAAANGTSKPAGTSSVGYGYLE